MYVYIVECIAKPPKRSRTLAVIEKAGLRFKLHKVFEQHEASRSHWHFKRAAGTGTLEVTWDERENTIRVIVHKNRVGADGWAIKQAPVLAQTLAEALDARVLSEHVTNGH